MTHRTSNVMHSLMQYKQWADADLIRRVIALPAPMAAPEGGLVTAIIRHYHTVDCIFRAHLLGKQVGVIPVQHAGELRGHDVARS